MDLFYETIEKIQGCHRWRCMYHSISILSVFLFFCSIVSLSPVKTLSLIIMSYIANGLWFYGVYMRLHVKFITTKREDLSIEGRFAYDHHYIDSSIYKKYWIPYRLIYFVNIPLSLKEKSWFIQYMILINIIVLFGTMYFGLLNITECTAIFSIYSILINYQAIVHEWYHVKFSEREEHFTYVYWIFRFLERIGVISTVHHRSHHQHDKDTLNQVKWFFDSKYIFENVGNVIFEKIIKSDNKRIWSLFVMSTCFIISYFIPIITIIVYNALFMNIE